MPSHLVWLMLGVLAPAVIGQQPPTKSVAVPTAVFAPQVTTLDLEYEKPGRVALLPTAIGFPFQCTGDGEIVFNTMSYRDDSLQADWAVFSVKPSGSLVPTRFDLNASGLREIQPGAVAVSSSRVALFVMAKSADEERKTGATKETEPQNYLLFFDRSGSFVRKMRLEESAVGSRMAFGLFDSGEVLVVGAKSLGSRIRTWKIMKEDGSSLRDLPMGQENVKEKNLSEKEVWAAFMELRGEVDFVPYRGHLLMTETNTDTPVVEIGEGGILRSVRLKLPEGLHIGHIIPSSKGTLLVALGKSGDFPFDLSPAGQPGAKLPKVFSETHLAEFDWETGELLRYINMGAGHYFDSIACEFAGVYYVLSVDTKSGSLQIEKATTH